VALLEFYDVTLEKRLNGPSRGTRPYFLNLRSFRKDQCILHVNAKLSHRTFDFCMAKKNLNRPRAGGDSPDAKIRVFSGCSVQPILGTRWMNL